MDFTEYFQAHDNYFWQWEDNAEVIAIPGGSTIAYNDLITDVIEKLSPQGLPPFGSLLLAILATNPGGKESIGDVCSILKKWALAHHQTLVDEAMAFLNMLADVPDALKKGPKRILLLSTIFSRCHNMVSGKKAERIYRTGTLYRRQGNKAAFSSLVSLPYSHGCFVRDVRTVALLHNKFETVEDIIRKVAALPDLPEDLQPLQEITGAEKEHDFIEQLIDNSKTFHSGALVRRIWSGLNIPVHNRTPSKQPLGGISDLTNKGDFDKLLVSEFANDDLVFLSRLANNEALFLHREIPPQNNNLERIILIDTSLRSWGTPKTVAFAIAVAIARHPKTDIPCSAYTVGKSYQQVSVNDIHGVIDGLQTLDSSLHAAEGLDLFFREQHPGPDKEVFIITTPAAMKQPAVLKIMNGHKATIHYRIEADADGHVDIFRKQPNSNKHIQHIQLPLQELWTKTKPKQLRLPAPVEIPDGKQRYYPILFRNVHAPKVTLPAADGEIFQVTKEKTLMRLFDKSATTYKRGWDMIAEKLAYVGGLLEIGIATDGAYVLLMFNIQKRELTLLNVSTGESKTVTFTGWVPSTFKNFMFYKEHFYYLSTGRQWQIDVDGNIRETNESSVELHDAYKARESAIATASAIYANTTLKNIDKLFINDRGNLVLNTWELRINNGGHIKLEQVLQQTETAAAAKMSNTVFVFTDGSTVEINKTGMLILHSPEERSKPVYVPLLLDVSLGIATDTAFSGNEYYYKEPQFEIILTNPGPEKIEVIRQIKDATDKGLRELKELIDTTPRKIASFLTQAKAMQLQSSLTRTGAQAAINRTQGSKPFPQEKIAPQRFFNLYITPFINHILQHATGR